MLRLTFEIELVSNYHISAGCGKGFGVDSALLTEAGRDGTPVLRGSTLTGLLRNAAWQLLTLPPLAMHHKKDEVLERIFGSPKRIKRWSISSGYPEKIRMEEKKVVQRVRIDPRTRRAENRNLFTQEEGKSEQLFGFDITCHQNDAPAIDEAAFIVAAARFVRQFGRSRRRGLGECTIHLKNVSGINDADKPDSVEWEDYLLEHFNQTWLKNNLQKLVHPGTKADIDTIVAPPSGAKMRVKLIIRLDEPLLISQRASAGNWFDTRPIIPGTTIRGALAALAATRCNLTNKNTYHDFVMLFLRGGITFPVLYPAYMLQSNIYPTLPAFLGLTTCNIAPYNDSKGHGVCKAWEFKKCDVCGNERLETIGNFFVLKKVDDTSRTHLPGQSSEMHVRIDPKSQRAVKGNLYGYNVLNAGQYFLGELNCANETAWKRLQEMTGISEKKELPLRLGKARQRGYGKVTAWFERQEDKPHVFIQTPISERVTNLEEAITLTLLTDTITTNHWGQQANGFTKEWLGQILNLGPLEIDYAHARTRVVDGFNTTLGLPRWRDTALMAGSMAQFYLKDPPPSDWQEKMKRLEIKGIGARRSEGFGQIVFNHPVYEMCANITSSAINIKERIPQYNLEEPREFSSYKLWEEKELPDILSLLKTIQDKENEKFNSCFAALARWLYSCSDTRIDELISQLKVDQEQFVLGQPQETLINAIGGDEEYGKRDIDNFYTNEVCVKGIRKIRQALKYLKDLDQSFHRRGIEQVADSIAGLTREKEVSRQ